MPDSAQAVLVFAVAVLPGAVFTWAFERRVGRWGIGLSDRLLRFVGVSAIFQAAYAWPLYWLRSRFMYHPVATDGHVSYENLVAQGRPLPWWVFLVPALYLVIPYVLGLGASYAVQGRTAWKRPLARAVARILVGRDPAPRAWDALFSDRPRGVVRARLTQSNSWVGGLFGDDSYAAGYPEQPQDLLLEEGYRVDSGGTFARDDDGRLVPTGSQVLLRWDEVELLEIFPLEAQ